MKNVYRFICCGLVENHTISPRNSLRIASKPGKIENAHNSGALGVKMAFICKVQ
jgi:hypothetical protein